MTIQSPREGAGTAHIPPNLLADNRFKRSGRLDDTHQFQFFATASLSLDRQDFHLKDFRPLVATRRGVALSALRSGSMTVKTMDERLAFRPADITVLPLGADATLSGLAASADCLVIDEQLNPLLPSGLNDTGPIVLSALEPATSLLYQQFICFRAYALLMRREDTEELLPPLLMMLNTILKRYGNSKTSTGNSQVDKVCAHIKRNLLDPDLDPDKIADQLGLSRAQLYRLAEPLGGIHKYIRTQRLQLAYKKLLQGGEGARSITNLSFDLGFGTETAFRRAFKEVFGMTPTQVRRREKLHIETN